MPSPIAHSVTGYAIARLFPRSPLGKPWGGLTTAVYGVVIANMADLDFVPQVLTGERYHRGPSHSLCWAIAFSLGVWLLGYGLTKRWSRQLLFFTLLGYGSHLLLDFFTQGGDGIQLLWPFSASYFLSPISIFPSTHWSKPLFWGHLVFLMAELGYGALLWYGLRYVVPVQRQQR